MNAPSHAWKFFRAGGFDQVKLETGADLLNLDKLDLKLWVALACPVNGLEFDARTLSLVDTDNDNRVRVPELIAALKWAGTLLKNPDDLARAVHPLPLSSINDAVPEGKQLLASAKQILINLGRANAQEISVADVSDASKIYANTIFNGDGVIVPESAANGTTRAVIADIIATIGSLPDRSGKGGIDQSRIDAFFAECAAFTAWHQQVEDERGKILPLGDTTSAAAAAVGAIKAKVDDYFGRCRLAGYDPRALPIVNRKEEEYAPLASRDVSINVAEMAAFPLAPIAAGKTLPLTGGVNPAHAAALEALRNRAVKPLLGEKSGLSEGDWTALQDKLAAFEAWSAAKAGRSVEQLGLARVREILASTAKEDLAELLARDNALAAEATSVLQVEKLTRFVRDLSTLCENFVNFKKLYSGEQPAIFQCGVLYLDQRSCHLCLTVEDAARHATMAGLAGAYIAYCDCIRRSTGEKMSIAAVFSQGDDDNLMVGRNGIFYDRKGRDYDATITKIVTNPISLRQAFWLPYKKFVRMIEELIAKRAAAADAASTARLEGAATTVTSADAVKAPPPAPKKTDVGTVAALGVAFGAIGGFLTAMATGMVKVASFGPLAIGALILGIMALISLPSLILAFIKLRKRNLGPILDANGWAVNARARINVPFGTSLTGIAKLPPGAQRDLRDKYAEKQSPWPTLIVLALVLYAAYAILNHLGYVYEWTNGRLGAEKKKPVVTEAIVVPVTVPATNNPAP